jgi:uncharacterized membrane protein
LTSIVLSAPELLPEESESATAPNRMFIALLALIGTLLSAYLSAYKLGLFGTILCGTGGCDTVQNSPWAVFLGVPVPFIGFAGYCALLVLSLLGLQPRFSKDRSLAGVLLAGATIGLLFTAYLTYLEAAVIHAWCRWCLGSAAIATLIFIAALPELRRMRRS